MIFFSLAIAKIAFNLPFSIPSWNKILLISRPDLIASSIALRPAITSLSKSTSGVSTLGFCSLFFSLNFYSVYCFSSYSLIM